MNLKLKMLLALKLAREELRFDHNNTVVVIPTMERRMVSQALRSVDAAIKLAEKKEPAKWFETWENVIALAEWMYAESMIDPDQIFYLLRKPWKYESEWAEFAKTSFGKRFVTKA